LKNLSLPAVLGFVLGGYFCCARCGAQIANPSASLPPTPTPTPLAEVLVLQLKSAKIEVRENAATALQTMGAKTAEALASYICRNLRHSSSCAPTPTIALSLRPNTRGENSVTDMQGTIKAVVVLGKIGKDVADDDNVRKALLVAANLPESTNWPQLQLAAIDALGEINKYRGVLLSTDDDDPMDTFDPKQAIDASPTLAGIARTVFEKLSTNRGDVPVQQDTDFYDCIIVIHHSQSELLHLAAQVSAAASSSKEKKKTAAEPAFSKLADAESLAASLRKIEIGYLDATKTLFATNPVKAADQPDDKSHWQLQTEAAYDLLTETTQLTDELDSLGDFRDDRTDLANLLSDLAAISNSSNCKLINCELIQATVAIAINQILSKPPEKKPATEEEKKEAKKEGEKKDAGKKDSPAAKGADKEKSKTQ